MTDQTFNRAYLATTLAISAILWALCIWITISRGVADTLSAQAGQDAASSSAATAKPAAYRLNPRFSLWLMGFPDAWASCGEQAMQSSRRSPKPSSAPGSPQPQTPQKGTRHETI